MTPPRVASGFVAHQLSAPPRLIKAVAVTLALSSISLCLMVSITAVWLHLGARAVLPA